MPVCKITIVFALFSLILGTSCTQHKALPHINQTLWKANAADCNGNRVQVWDQLQPNKEELLGYDENELNWLLGPPSHKNLLEKGQKAYYYYISGNPACKNSLGSKPLLMVVRVNATGYVSEVGETATIAY